MDEDNFFELRIGGCKIKCNKQTASDVSGVIGTFFASNSEQNYYELDLPQFSENYDKDLVSNILNNQDNKILPKGRENFFRHFCTKLDIYPFYRNSVKISSIIDENDKVNCLISLEEHLIHLTADNLESTAKQFIKNSEAPFHGIDCYTVSRLILNACYARPFKIELYIDFLLFLASIDDQIRTQNSTRFLDIFFKCFSIELQNCLRSSTLVDNIDEVLFLFRYLFDSQDRFLRYLNSQTAKPKDFLSTYFPSTTLKNINTLKPLFIELTEQKNNISIELLEEYIESYNEIRQNNFEKHKSDVHQGLNPDILARLIIKDDDQSLESLLTVAFQRINNPNIDSENVGVIDIEYDDNQLSEIMKRLQEPVYKIPKSLYERCSYLNKEPTLLQYAAFCGSTKSFKMLLKHQSENPDFQLDLGINNDLLKFAVAGGNFEIIKIICEMGQFTAKSFFSSFNDSISYHRWEICEWLIDEKFDYYNYPNFLLNCISHSNFKTFLHLLTNKAFGHISLLSTCCKYGNLILAKEFLAISPYDAVNFIDPNDQTSILHYACLIEHEELLKLILNHFKQNPLFSIDVNKQTGLYYKNSTALHIAVDKNNNRFTKLLFDYGHHETAETSLIIDIKNSRSMTPFHIACLNGNTDMVKLFLNQNEYEFDINAHTDGIFIFFFLLID